MTIYFGIYNTVKAKGKEWNQAQNKVFLKMAKEMVELYPELILTECLKMIVNRYQENKKMKQDSFDERNVKRLNHRITNKIIGD